MCYVLANMHGAIRWVNESMAIFDEIEKYLCGHGVDPAQAGAQRGQRRRTTCTSEAHPCIIMQYQGVDLTPHIRSLLHRPSNDDSTIR